VESPKPRILPAESKRLGARIAQLRREAGYTQERLAEKVGIASRHLQRIELGGGPPSLAVIATIRRVLGVTWASLFKQV
jgi:transcriptional regulator with XRE-family HTH domain